MLLSVAGSATSKSWATGSTKTQPDADLRALIDAVGDSIMLDANRLLIGSKAWSTRLEVYESSTAPYAGVAANFGAQQLADKLGLDGVFKSTERVETTSGKAKVTNSAYAVAFVGVDGATDLDPLRSSASGARATAAKCSASTATKRRSGWTLQSSTTPTS